MRVVIFVMSLGFSFPCLAKERYVEVDLKNFKWSAYEGDRLIKSGVATGGRKFCPDIKRKCKTPQGEFRVLVKKNKFYRSPSYPLGCNNNSKIIKERCAEMPYAIKFRYQGEALHGHYKENWEKPSHISHGCIHVDEPKWLNEFVEIGDKIIVLPY